MNPLQLILFVGTTKKQVYFTLATTFIILCLPMMAVFALGAKTLSFLSFDSSFSHSEGVYQGPLSSTDKYDWGNCTYWVALLRQQANDPIPNTWGNAETWAYNAKIDGYLVDKTPSVGAIMQISGVDNNLGHVAYVKSVDPDSGSWTISEMNVKGLDIVDVKVMPALEANQYNFIHDKLTSD